MTFRCPRRKDPVSTTSRPVGREVVCFYRAVSVGTQWESRGKNAWRGLGTKGFAQKKVLSLVLCVAMLLSVMVMGTGAAFTDQDEIQNAEAVDMTSALGIIDGYEDGSFQPAENIERGEAVKMISAMLNGGRDAVQETTESSYNDVLGSVDAWANKYIEYCTARGIVSGVGGDRFAPASNVTGTQLAKMLLVSLGYDSVKEGYQDNAMWSVNVNTDAVAAGLYAGIETIDMSAPLSRDNAAQMIWNALQAETVRYTLVGQVVKTGDTLLETAFGDDYGLYSGVMVQVYYNKDKAEYTYSVVDVNVDRNDWDWSEVVGGGAFIEDAEAYVTSADYSDLFGMNVTVLHKGDEALMIRVNEGGVVVEGVVGDIGGLNNNNANTFTVNGQKYRLDNVVGDMASVAVPYNGFDDFNNVDPLEQYSFRAIDLDGGGDVDLFVYYPYVVLKTDLVKADTFRANQITPADAYLTVLAANQDAGMVADLTGTIEYDDVIVNGTVAIDGYVKAVPATYTAQGEDTYDVLTMANASVTRAANKDLLITLGDTQYDGGLLEQIESFKQISVGKDYGFIAVNGYLFIMDGTGIVPENYTVITALAKSSSAADGTIKADLLMADGTTVSEADVSFVGNEAQWVGSMFTFTIKSDGTYVLTPVEDGAAKDTTSIFDLQQAFETGANLDNTPAEDAEGVDADDMLGINTAGDGIVKNQDTNTWYVIEDDAVVFAFINRTPHDGDQRTSEYVVLTGAELTDAIDNGYVQSWAFTGAYEVSQKTMTADMLYVKLGADPRDTSEYAYVADVNERANSNGHYAEIDVITVNGDTTLTTPAYENQRDPVLMDIYDNLEEGSVYQVIYDKDGKLVGYALLTFSYGTVTATDGRTITVTDNAGTSTTLVKDDPYEISIDGDTIQVGEVIAYAPQGGTTPDLIVYGLAAVSDCNIGAGIDNADCEVEVTRDINNVTVALTKTSGATFNDAGDRFSLTVKYTTGKTATYDGVKSDDDTTISFTFVATNDVESMTVAHK